MNPSKINIYTAGQGSVAVHYDGQDLASLSNRGGQWVMAILQAGGKRKVVRKDDGRPADYSRIIHNTEALKAAVIEACEAQAK